MAIPFSKAWAGLIPGPMGKQSQSNPPPTPFIPPQQIQRQIIPQQGAGGFTDPAMGGGGPMGQVGYLGPPLVDYSAQSQYLQNLTGGNVNNPAWQAGFGTPPAGWSAFRSGPPPAQYLQQLMNYYGTPQTTASPPWAGPSPAQYVGDLIAFYNQQGMTAQAQYLDSLIGGVSNIFSSPWSSGFGGGPNNPLTKLWQPPVSTGPRPTGSTGQYIHNPQPSGGIPGPSVGTGSVGTTTPISPFAFNPDLMRGWLNRPAYKPTPLSGQLSYGGG